MESGFWLHLPKNHLSQNIIGCLERNCQQQHLAFCRGSKLPETVKPFRTSLHGSTTGCTNTKKHEDDGRDSSDNPIPWFNDPIPSFVACGETPGLLGRSRICSLSVENGKFQFSGLYQAYNFQSEVYQYTLGCAIPLPKWKVQII